MVEAGARGREDVERHVGTVLALQAPAAGATIEPATCRAGADLALHVDVRDHVPTRFWYRYLKVAGWNKDNLWS